jgi:hypothetical protein
MSRSREIRLAVSLGMLSSFPSLAQAALSFNAGASAITYQHDVIEGGTVNRTVTQPTPAIQTPSTVTFVLPDLTLTGSSDGVPTLKSRAKVGFAHNETTTVGTGLFKASSLLTQSDPGNLSSAYSTLDIDFDLHWNVTAPGFGPPIIGSFSVPLLAVVGPGGAASAELIDMHWERFDGFTTTDLRAPANTSIAFSEGTTLTTLTIPGAAFSPAGLTTGDQFIVRGTVRLAVKNADAPVMIVIDPDYQQMVIDDGAVVQYRFDDGAIGTSPLIAQDSAPANGASNGSYGGNSPLVPGLRGAALRPDNVNQRIDTSFSSSTSFTAELWAASDTPTWNAPGWLISSNSANAFRLSPLLNTTLVEVAVFDSAGNEFVVGVFDVGALDITHLHHYVITYDDATNFARLFFDGQQVLDTNLGSILRDPGTPMNIRLGFGSEAGLGVIDEFAYYEEALRAEVINAHFQVGISNPDGMTRIIGAQVLDDSAIPEPATAGLIGLAMMGLMRRRRLE